MSCRSTQLCCAAMLASLVLFASSTSAGGDLFVTNQDANTVSEVTTAGTVSPFASGLNGPSGLAFGANGDLYVANLDNNSVSMITPGESLAASPRVSMARVRGL